MPRQHPLSGPTTPSQTRDPLLITPVRLKDKAGHRARAQLLSEALHTGRLPQTWRAGDVLPLVADASRCAQGARRELGEDHEQKLIG